jgi:hypothetical protein
MFFSKLARVLAIVTFVLGLLTALFATAALMGFLDDAAVTRYVGKSPGKNLDLGIYIVLLAVALGTLAEISLSIRKAIELPEE